MKISDNQEHHHVSPVDQHLQWILDSIPHVHNFKGKWSLIRTRLLNLKTHISDISDFPSSATNTLTLDLLRSLPVTLSDAASLCQACKSLNLPNGKLRTQNDVDSLSARLDCHVHDAELLLKSGVLRDDDVVFGSVRVETRSLITRLQIGSSESRNSAMDSLLSLIYDDDDKNVVIAVAQGIVPVLVSLLDSLSSPPEIRENAVAAIARVSISTADSIAEGLHLLNNLLRVLESGSGFAKEKSCIALNALSRTKENARAIGSRGGISSLLEICQTGTPISQAAAAAVLKNLSAFAEIKENFLEENAISVLLSLSATGTSSAQENAIACLTHLSVSDHQLKLFIAREGGIDNLKNYWDSSPTIHSLESAVNMVKNLSSSPQIAETLISEGFPNKLVSLLTCEVLSLRIASAKAIYELSFNSRTQKDIWDSGCIPVLVRMLLDGNATEEREAAAMALSAVIVHGGNKKMFRKEARGIIGTVQLLDPVLQGLDKKYPVSILGSLVESKKCRKEMVASGACMHLQKLVEMGDVEGAKKLSECLGKGKLWGVFARP